MRAKVLILGLTTVAGCQAPWPLAPRPVTLTVQATATGALAPAFGDPVWLALNMGPSAFAMAWLSRQAAGGAVGPSPAAPASNPVFGLSAGGLAAELGLASATWRSGFPPDTGLPGWGTGGWGPTGLMPAGSGTAPPPGQFNLSRGAGQIGGWGLDGGFFSIPQTEQRARLDAAMKAIDQSTAGVPGVGQTRLDPKKYPFLKPVKGPLVPPT